MISKKEVDIARSRRRHNNPPPRTGVIIVRRAALRAAPQQKRGKHIKFNPTICAAVKEPMALIEFSRLEAPIRCKLNIKDSVPTALLNPSPLSGGYTVHPIPGPSSM